MKSISKYDFQENSEISFTDVVILCPTGKESEVVRTFLEGGNIITKESANYYCGTFKAKFQNLLIAIRETGSGIAAITQETEQAMRLWAPKVILLVGCAGGIKDVDLFDIVIATVAYSYEYGKEETSKGGFQSRPKSITTSQVAIEHAKAINLSKNWHDRITKPRNDQKVVFGPIASGNQVVADRSAPIFNLIRQHYNDTVAVEMEAFGFGFVTQKYPEIFALNIRGISDLIDNKNTVEKSLSSQSKATNIAAAFAFELLFELPPSIFERSFEYIPRVSDWILVTFLGASRAAKIIALRSAKESIPIVIRTPIEITPSPSRPIPPITTPSQFEPSTPTREIKSARLPNTDKQKFKKQFDAVEKWVKRISPWISVVRVFIALIAFIPFLFKNYSKPEFICSNNCHPYIKVIEVQDKVPHSNIYRVGRNMRLKIKSGGYMESNLWSTVMLQLDSLKWRKIDEWNPIADSSMIREVQLPKEVVDEHRIYSIQIWLSRDLIPSIVENASKVVLLKSSPQINLEIPFLTITTIGGIQIGSHEFNDHIFPNLVTIKGASNFSAGERISIDSRPAGSVGESDWRKIGDANIDEEGAWEINCEIRLACEDKNKFEVRIRQGDYGIIKGPYRMMVNLPTCTIQRVNGNKISEKRRKATINKTCDFQIEGTYDNIVSGENIWVVIIGYDKKNEPSTRWTYQAITKANNTWNITTKAPQKNVTYDIYAFHHCRRPGEGIIRGAPVQCISQKF